MKILTILSLINRSQFSLHSLTGEEIHPDLLYKVHTTAGRCYLAQSNHSEALESFESAQSTALLEWGESAAQLVYLYQYIVQVGREGTLGSNHGK